MAKKHSSKTATEKAMSASEPRLQVFSGWQGVNFAQAPLDWEPYEPLGPHKQRQEDLKPNFFHVQNNLVTVDNLTVETRMDSEIIGHCPVIRHYNDLTEEYTETKLSFTGVSCLFHRWLFCVAREGKPDTNPDDALHDATFVDHVYWRNINGEFNNDWINGDDPEDHRPDLDLQNGKWNEVKLIDAEDENTEGYEVCELGYFEKNLIATTRHIDWSTPDNRYVGEIFTANLNYSQQLETDEHGINIKADNMNVQRLRSVPYVPNPGEAFNIPSTTDAEVLRGRSKPTITAKGSNTSGNNPKFKIQVGGDAPAWAEAMVEFSYSYVNKFGSTIASGTTTIYASTGPQNWNAAQYVRVSGSFPTNLNSTYVSSGEIFADKYQVKGVDVYVTVEGYQTKSFAAHVDIGSGAATWGVNYLGGMQDVSQWTNVALEEPKENSTKGVRASHFASHDSRLYFWGDPEYPYRLYVGGNPGNELSVARGHGGAFVDIEPGTGLEVKGTAKWKTSSGANIITIMCGNPNTNMIKRFNLVETNLTITNEVSSKGYMYEEVSNVVGCNSRWGYGVFADGLYSINRYGLMLTTMAMEYNNQMRIQSISDVIKPIFSERLGHRLDDARMVCIDNVIYILLSEEATHPGEPTILDQVVLCYDLGLKAWYTLTSDEILGSGELILHAMSIDSQEHAEGLGLITKDTVILYPNTGIQEPTAPDFNVLIETGELMGKQPKQMTLYLCQLELRFDYFIGHATVEIEGIDYYGRPVTIIKELNSRKMGGDTPTAVSDTIMRDYTEWIRIDKLMESYRIRIKGKARFRLNSINAKVYTQDDKIGLPYGFDSHVYYQNRYGNQNLGYTNDDNHWLMDYNNLRRTLLT